MTDTNVVKQLEELLKPIKKDLGVINKKLVVLDKKLEGLDERHSKKLDQHTESLVNIESTIKVYGDMYDINNGNVRKLEKRIGGDWQVSR